MAGKRFSHALLLVLVGLFCSRCAAFGQETSETPVNLKIAFFGDQGTGNGPRSVLQLIRDENADAVLHLGDLDYKKDPQGWEQRINEVLGPNFPYFTLIGNHDVKSWSGSNGYQALIEARMQRLGLKWDGQMGVQSSFSYKGILIVMVAPGIQGSGHDLYIKNQLAKDKSIWRICAWHKNMTRMQVGHKTDDTGWEVYREARKGGAIIATAHEHSYSRTFLLSDIENQVVASTSDTLEIGPGRTFVFVSGLGGKSIRNQERDGAWWASIYTSDQNANYGALFGEFNYQGIPNLAHFYFKDIDGNVPDEFYVISHAGSGVTSVPVSGAIRADDFTLAQNYPNPFNPSTIIAFSLAHPASIKLVITGILGREYRTLVNGFMAAGSHRVAWDGRDEAGQALPGGIYFYRLTAGKHTLSRRLILLK